MFEIYSSVDAAIAMLEAVRRKVEAKGAPTPSEALLLYAALPEEGGIGNRAVADPLLIHFSVVDPGIEGLAGILDSYAAQASLLRSGHAQLDGQRGAQALEILVAMRGILDRATRVLEVCCADLDLSFSARVEGIEYATRDVDAEILDEALNLLPFVRRVQGSRAKAAKSAGGGASAAAVPWWSSNSVGWWKSLRTWAEDGMSDADHAGNWLIPALHRASEKAAAGKRRKR